MLRQLLLEFFYRTPKVFALSLEAIDRRGKLLWKDRERTDAAGHRFAKRAEDTQRAAAAGKRHARAAFELLDGRHEDRADVARARHVCAAARGEVEIPDVDQPQHAAARRLLPQRQQPRLVGRHETDRDLAVLPDHAVRL